MKCEICGKAIGDSEYVTVFPDNEVYYKCHKSCYDQSVVSISYEANERCKYKYSEGFFDGGKCKEVEYIEKAGKPVPPRQEEKAVEPKVQKLTSYGGGIYECNMCNDTTAHKHIGYRTDYIDKLAEKPTEPEESEVEEIEVPPEFLTEYLQDFDEGHRIAVLEMYCLKLIKGFNRLANEIKLLKEKHGR